MFGYNLQLNKTNLTIKAVTCISTQPLLKEIKLIKIVFVLVTVLYIFLEIAFQARMLDVIGVISNETIIKNTEIIGRSISSIGFALFFVPKILSKIKIYRHKIISAIIAYPVVAMAFFVAQILFINMMVDSLPQDIKKRAVYLEIHKQSMYFGKKNNQGKFYDPDNKYLADDKVFIANLPLLNIANDHILNLIKKNKRALVYFTTSSFIEANKETYRKLRYDTENKYYKMYLFYLALTKDRKRLLSEKVVTETVNSNKDKMDKYKRFYGPGTFKIKTRKEIRNQYIKSVNEGSQNRLKNLIIEAKMLAYNLESHERYDLSSDYFKTYTKFKYNLNPKQFFYKKEIFKLIKDTTPFMVDKNNKLIFYYPMKSSEYNKYRSYSSNDKATEASMGIMKINQTESILDLLNDFEDEKLLKQYSKALVVPPFVLFMSTMMVILNIFNLLFYLLPQKWKQKKIMRWGFVSIFFAFIVFVAINENAYTKHDYYKKIELQGGSKVMIYETIFVQNLSILFSYVDLFNPTFNRVFNYLEIRVLDRKGIFSSHRRYMLKKEQQKVK